MSTELLTVCTRAPVTGSPGRRVPAAAGTLPINRYTTTTGRLGRDSSMVDPETLQTLGQLIVVTADQSAVAACMSFCPSVCLSLSDTAYVRVANNVVFIQLSVHRCRYSKRHRCTQIGGRLLLDCYAACVYPRDAMLARVLSVVACLCVCLCVRHTPVLYRNGCTDRADFLYTGFPRPMLRCVLRKLGCLKK